MNRNFFRVFNPILYQGGRKRSPYFEGWYFKHVCAGSAGPRTFSVIPGISKSADGDTAFIQTLSGGPEVSSRFFVFPFSEFSYSDRPFGLRIGANSFSLEGVLLDLEDEAGRIAADLRYRGTVAPRAGTLKPGVMGPYSFVPFMECSHGIASLRHEIDGAAVFSGESVSFSGGLGYIEKDWGRSMPTSWIWMQSNSFDPAVGPASFSLSIARVPWLLSSFVGFICLFWVGGREYRFASYTGARVESLETDGVSTRIILCDKSYRMEIRLRRPGSVPSGAAVNETENPKTSLLAPVDGALSRSIVETVDGALRIVLKRRRASGEELVMDAAAPIATAEIAGDVSALAPRGT